MTRILIAAADPLIAGFLEKGCRLHGFSTMVTDDRRGVLELAGSGEYDLLVVDSRLPDADGVRALRELRDGASRLPMVILSGHGRPGERLADFGGSADDLLAKPFRFEQLLLRIHTHLGHAGAESARALRVGRATLFPEARLLVLGSERYALDLDELQLMLAFFIHPGDTLSPEELLADQPADSTEPADGVLRRRLERLNRKVGRELIKSTSRVDFSLDTGGDEGP